MVFVQKRRLSVFSHWPIMERSHNLPDLGSHISKFRVKHFIDIVTDINRCRFQGGPSFGVVITSIQTFSEVRSLEVTWWSDLEWPGYEISTICAEKMHEQVCPPPGTAQVYNAPNTFEFKLGGKWKRPMDVDSNASALSEYNFIFILRLVTWHSMTLGWNCNKMCRKDVYKCTKKRRATPLFERYWQKTRERRVFNMKHPLEVVRTG